ncbi:MAG: dTDP-4-dehydrorhamnose reductase [Dethiobacter sp.]|nr:dTDP-4-dehydrorhamnose reductase [Dethiobacter sp.]
MKSYLWPRILLTGKNGQVGWELRHALTTLGEVVALDREQLDLANPDQIRKRVRDIKPDLIVNAAAYTAVDKAEEEAELAMAVNGIAPGILAEEAKKLNALIVHFSTDYVFDGSKTTPYTEEDVPNPINVYGRTKFFGEQAIQAVGTPYLILRTSWVYGLRGKNFLLTILRLSRERSELKIVDDQIGAPTWSRTIAEATAGILSTGHLSLSANTAVYHLTASGKTSWYEFAKAILALDPNPTEQVCQNLVPIPTSEYPTPARRPAYSVLSNAKLEAAFGVKLPYWEEGLTRALSR